MHCIAELASTEAATKAVLSAEDIVAGHYRRFLDALTLLIWRARKLKLDLHRNISLQAQAWLRKRRKRKPHGDLQSRARKHATRCETANYAVL